MVTGSPSSRESCVASDALIRKATIALAIPIHQTPRIERLARLREEATEDRIG